MRRILTIKNRKIMENEEKVTDLVVKSENNGENSGKALKKMSKFALGVGAGIGMLSIPLILSKQMRRIILASMWETIRRSKKRIGRLTNNIKTLTAQTTKRGEAINLKLIQIDKENKLFELRFWGEHQELGNFITLDLSKKIRPNREIKGFMIIDPELPTHKLMSELTNNIKGKESETRTVRINIDSNSTRKIKFMFKCSNKWKEFDTRFYEGFVVIKREVSC